MLERGQSAQLIDNLWHDSIVPEIEDYIRIPNKSPLFDPQWQSHGYMDDATEHMVKWAREQPVRDMTVEVIRLPNLTPLIYIEVAGQGDRNVVLYGHLDKQPEMVGWREGLGPWQPVIKDGRLYGRGGADDGYALYASLAAVQAVQSQNLAHANLKIIIEASEESGSPDLPAYIDHLAERIGSPDLVVCLDSGCGNYDQLWTTTSLRGMAGGNLIIDILDEGVHSGDASGIVPTGFRIARQLLARLEDTDSGEILLDALKVDIPPDRVEQAQFAAEVLGDEVYTKFPFIAGAEPAASDLSELILNRTWRAALEITGADGLPALRDAGNVLRPHTALKLSMRLPPTADADAACEAITSALQDEPPYAARVRFETEKSADGWNAPTLAPWLAKSLETASQQWFGQAAAYMGEGGTIPFMGMLGEKFPAAQFLVTGVLGPQSNAHGPNEFLDLKTARRLTGCVSQVLVDHYQSTEAASA